MDLAAINVKRTKEVFLLMWVYVICDRNGHKVFTKRRESYLTPFDVSVHIKWCERSYQMV